MAHAFPSPTDAVDLDVLEDFLLSDRSPKNAMKLSGIDGFLSGIAAGPVAIGASEWMPVVWQGEKPAFSGIDEARRIVGIIVHHHDEIVAQLSGAPDAYASVFSTAPDGRMICEEWVDGFFSAMALRKDAWTPLFRSPDDVFLLLPILAVCPADEVRTALVEELPGAARLAKEAPDLIPRAVVSIHDFWKDRQAPGE